MLTQEQLIQLYRAHQSDNVLSVYLDGEANDPAQRSVWRKRFEQGLADTGRALENADSDSRAAFERAAGRIRGELDQFDAFLPGKGWVGFATADALLYAESVTTPMPDLVRWERGLRVAPFVRGLKQSRPVFLVLADRRRARVFEYRDGTASELPGVVADTDVGDLTDMGVGKRGAVYSGVRGQTGTDAAQRYLEQNSERMLKSLMATLEERVGTDGFLVVGGTPETVSALSQHASAQLSRRLLEQPSLHLDMSAADVKAAAEDSASVLTQRQQEGLVDEVLDQARSGGRGCLGAEATERALREGRVDTLLLTRDFIREVSDFADHCVGAAFDQHAEVEELSGEAATRLDRDGGGIGARLRFVIRDEGAATAEAEPVPRRAEATG